MVFDELNRISDIPIHRRSNKYKKIGSGVVYYNNAAGLWIDPYWLEIMASELNFRKLSIH